MKNNNFICWFSPKDNERKKKRNHFIVVRTKAGPPFVCIISVLSLNLYSEDMLFLHYCFLRLLWSFPLTVNLIMDTYNFLFYLLFMLTN